MQLSVVQHIQFDNTRYSQVLHGYSYIKFCFMLLLTWYKVKTASSCLHIQIFYMHSTLQLKTLHTFLIVYMYFYINLQHLIIVCIAIASYVAIILIHIIKQLYVQVYCDTLLIVSAIHSYMKSFNPFPSLCQLAMHVRRISSTYSLIQIIAALVEGTTQLCSIQLALYIYIYIYIYIYYTYIQVATWLDTYCIYVYSHTLVIYCTISS